MCIRDRAKAVAKIADAVVVGSRMVQAVESSSSESVVANLAALTAELRQAIDSH
jgi:tryptophan synthase alpha chain